MLDVLISSNLLEEGDRLPYMPMRAGTYLVSPAQTDLEYQQNGETVSITNTDVYAVEPEGVLRLIATQEDVKNLYGKDYWTYRVIDLSNDFLSDYEIKKGDDDIVISIYPKGTLVRDKDTLLNYYIEDNQKRLITGSVFGANRFQEKFVITDELLKEVGGLDLSMYPGGEALQEFGDFYIALPIHSMFGQRYYLK